MPYEAEFFDSWPNFLINYSIIIKQRNVNGVKKTFYNYILYCEKKLHTISRYRQHRFNMISLEPSLSDGE